MGFSDFVNKAKNLADQHDEQVDQGLDRAGDEAKKRFAGHDEHIDSAWTGPAVHGRGRHHGRGRRARRRRCRAARRSTCRPGRARSRPSSDPFMTPHRGAAARRCGAPAAVWRLRSTVNTGHEHRRRQCRRPRGRRHPRGGVGTPGPRVRRPGVRGLRDLDAGDGGPRGRRVRATPTPMTPTMPASRPAPTTSPMSSSGTVGDTGDGSGREAPRTRRTRASSRACCATPRSPASPATPAPRPPNRTPRRPSSRATSPSARSRGSATTRAAVD